MSDRQWSAERNDGGAASIAVGLVVAAFIAAAGVWYLGALASAAHTVVIDVPSVARLVPIAQN